MHFRALGYSCGRRLRGQGRIWRDRKCLHLGHLLRIVTRDISLSLRLLHLRILSFLLNGCEHFVQLLDKLGFPLLLQASFLKLFLLFLAHFLLLPFVDLPLPRLLLFPFHLRFLFLLSQSLLFLLSPFNFLQLKLLFPRLPLQFFFLFSLNLSLLFALFPLGLLPLHLLSVWLHSYLIQVSQCLLVLLWQ